MESVVNGLLKSKSNKDNPTQALLQRINELAMQEEPIIMPDAQVATVPKPLPVKDDVTPEIRKQINEFVIPEEPIIVPEPLPVPKNNTAGQGGNTAGKEGDKGTDWLSTKNIGSYIGGVASPLLALLDKAQGNTGLHRIREKEVDEALVQNLSNRSQLLNQSPEAIRRAKENSLRAGMTSVANASANAGASASSNSGMGGGINSALIAGINASAPMAQATAGTQQAIANTFSEREQAQAMLDKQIGQNTMDRGTLAEMTAYHQLQNGVNSYRDILDIIAGGAGTGNRLVAMLNGSVDDKTKDINKK